MITELHKKVSTDYTDLRHLCNLWILDLPTHVHDRSLIRILFSLT